MKVEWKAVAGVVGLSLTFIGLILTTQWRLADRVSTLETLLTPILIEYKVEQRLKEIRNGMETVHSGELAPASPPMMVPHLAPPEDELREEAKQWAQHQFKR